MINLKTNKTFQKQTSVLSSLLEGEWSILMRSNKIGNSLPDAFSFILNVSTSFSRLSKSTVLVFIFFITKRCS